MSNLTDTGGATSGDDPNNISAAPAKESSRVEQEQTLDFADGTMDNDFTFNAASSAEHEEADDVVTALETSLGEAWREHGQQRVAGSSAKRPLPDGEFRVEVEKLWIGRQMPDNAASPIVFNWKCRVLDGEYEGAITSHRVHANQWTIGVIRRDLELAGLPNETSFADLRLVQEFFPGLRFLLRIKTDQWATGFFDRKTYFNARLADKVDLEARLREGQAARKVVMEEICPFG